MTLVELLGGQDGGGTSLVLVGPDGILYDVTRFYPGLGGTVWDDAPPAAQRRRRWRGRSSGTSAALPFPWPPPPTTHVKVGVTF